LATRMKSQTSGQSGDLNSRSKPSPSPSCPPVARR
ncbi:uncharacterized, partial [Tachysurus ichikawai]